MKGNEIFAKRIKKLREERQESQEDLARLVGYQKQTISHWEISGKVPRSKVLEILARHYNTTSDYLLGITSGTDTAHVESEEFSAAEMELLLRFRMMEKKQKDTMLRVAESIADFKTGV